MRENQRSLPGENPFPSLDFDAPGTFRSDVWLAIATWAAREIDAKSAFVCDTNGLIIAELGASDVTQRTASIVVQAMEVMGKAADPPRPPTEVNFAIDSFRVSSFSCPLGGSAKKSGPVIIGLISNHWPSAEQMFDLMLEIKSKISTEVRTLQLD